MFKRLILPILLIFSLNVLSEEDFRETLREGEYDFVGEVKTNIRNPFEMRDPFRRERVSQQEQEAVTQRRTEGFEFTNMPTIENVSLNRIRITGILLGENRRAIARIIESGAGTGEERLSSESFILKEGMTLGEYDAEIKAILPGGVVLVEQILNVYDQVEFIETILPVRPER